MDTWNVNFGSICIIPAYGGGWGHFFALELSGTNAIHKEKFFGGRVKTKTPGTIKRLLPLYTSTFLPKEKLKHA